MDNSLHRGSALLAQNLALIVNFFDPRWRQPIHSLNEGSRSWALASAGFVLRALGRLREALEPMERGDSGVTCPCAHTPHQTANQHNPGDRHPQSVGRGVSGAFVRTGWTS